MQKKKEKLFIYLNYMLDANFNKLIGYNLIREVIHYSRENKRRKKNKFGLRLINEIKSVGFTKKRLTIHIYLIFVSISFCLNYFFFS